MAMNQPLWILLLDSPFRIITISVAVSGDGFLARDICIENRAGAKKHQAVALRVNADFAALYKCHINGYQDTLMPMPSQFTVIIAQSRDSPDEDTGISIQNCSIFATNDLYSSSSNWSNYNDDQELKTLYYGEYDNSGPDSSTDDRVQWKGYHIMDVDVAYNFTVSEFINSNEWLDSTAFPYDHGV
ncbi:probable pectinesterase/pectinesterase inhibitor 12 [Quercus robur]|uniref:probable pectinesterase/pectinesterase inhibitor 12 n=1 Tax=Quercus robur TaxID=38942 RepID=UPI002161D466|nr:probable pectinesterase/pectinesterase inhibitor 12 [Quercus robur]